MNGPSKWSKCSNIIKGRSGKQCRERWFNTLNPEVKKGNWNPEEDYKIFVLFEKFGSKWSKIASFFKGRTENSIKNRFYSTLRRIHSDMNKDYFIENSLEESPTQNPVSNFDKGEKDNLQMINEEDETSNMENKLKIDADKNIIHQNKALKLSSHQIGQDELLKYFKIALTEKKESYESYVRNNKDKLDNDPINIKITDIIDKNLSNIEELVYKRDQQKNNKKIHDKKMNLNFLGYDAELKSDISTKEILMEKDEQIFSRDIKYNKLLEIHNNSTNEKLVYPQPLINNSASNFSVHEPQEQFSDSKIKIELYDDQITDRHLTNKEIFRPNNFDPNNMINNNFKYGNTMNNSDNHERLSSLINNISSYKNYIPPAYKYLSNFKEANVSQLNNKESKNCSSQSLPILSPNRSLNNRFPNNFEEHQKFSLYQSKQNSFDMQEQIRVSQTLKSTNDVNVNIYNQLYSSLVDDIYSIGSMLKQTKSEIQNFELVKNDLIPLLSSKNSEDFNPLINTFDLSPNNFFNKNPSKNLYENQVDMPKMMNNKKGFSNHRLNLSNLSLYEKEK